VCQNRRDYCLWLILHDEVTGVELKLRVRCVHEFSLQHEGVFTHAAFSRSPDEESRYAFDGACDRLRAFEARGECSAGSAVNSPGPFRQEDFHRRPIRSRMRRIRRCFHIPAGGERKAQTPRTRRLRNR
jgi:hypothetical protein